MDDREFDASSGEPYSSPNADVNAMRLKRMLDDVYPRSADPESLSYDSWQRSVEKLKEFIQNNPKPKKGDRKMNQQVFHPVDQPLIDGRFRGFEGNF